jgi:hypothetical protein
MFEKIGRAAEKMATSVSLSRRGFFSRLAVVAGGAALGLTALLVPEANAGNPRGAVCCCKKHGVILCCCFQGDPNLYYCMQHCCARC